MDDSLRSLYLFDSHAHLCDPSYTEGERVDLLDAIQGGALAGIVDVGFDLVSSRVAAENAEAYSRCFAAAGIHPLYMDSLSLAHRWEAGNGVETGSPHGQVKTNRNNTTAQRHGIENGSTGGLRDEAANGLETGSLNGRMQTERNTATAQRHGIEDGSTGGFRDEAANDLETGSPHGQVKTNRNNAKAQRHGIEDCSTGGFRDEAANGLGDAIAKDSGLDFDDAFANALNTLAQLCKRPAVRAVGETGLDYHIQGLDTAARARQQALFRAQIRLAKALAMPMIVHDRKAHGDVLRILKEEKAFEGAGILMHGFSGSAELAKEYVKLGALISFSGSITWIENRKAAAACVVVPQEQLLIETDAPWLTPEPQRGARNSPLWLAHTAQRIAELRAVPLETLSESTGANARRLFGDMPKDASIGISKGAPIKVPRAFDLAKAPNAPIEK